MSEHDDEGDKDDDDDDLFCLDLESLDRALQEVEALLLIYGNDNDNDDDAACHRHGAAADGPLSSARMVLKSSCEEMNHAKSLVEQMGSAVSTRPVPTTPTRQQQQAPTIALEMHLQVNGQTDEDDERGSSRNDNSNTFVKAESIQVCLYFGLVPGYPSRRPVTVRVLTAQGLSMNNKQTSREQLGIFLQAKSNELVGSEAIMDLVQACQDRLTAFLMESKSNSRAKCDNEIQDDTTNNQHRHDRHHSSSITAWSRRWIWVHHITDRQRKQDIVQEARHFQLGGYLKAGYPGIVVVEGPCQACNDFVIWIKGNKSRPGGGFGRNWGHHVRGELVVTEPCLTKEPFRALEEDMAVLAAACRKHHLQDEFKKFVMQHG